MVHYHQGEERAHDGPSDANHRLFVAHGDIAPSENGEQFAIVPKVGPVVPLGAAGFEDENALNCR